MESEIISKLADLGGTVSVVAMFIWYLTNKNGKAEKAMKSVTDSIQRLHEAQDKHTQVLYRLHSMFEDGK